MVLYFFFKSIGSIFSFSFTYWMDVQNKPAAFVSGRIPLPSTSLTKSSETPNKEQMQQNETGAP